MKRRVIKGAILGAAAGIIDLIPMVIKNLPINANLSAFSMWVVIGVILSVTNIQLKGYFKGIIISLLVLLPNIFIIGWEKPFGLIPIIISTIILGSLLGLFIDKILMSKNG